MKPITRLIWIVFALFAVTPMTSVHAANPTVVDPSTLGFAYLQHSAGPDLWTVGNVFTIVTIGQTGDLVFGSVDDAVNEYTLVLENLRVANYQEFGGFGFIDFEAGMIFSIYEDSRATGTGADFGLTAPPNGVSPGSFIDGTLLASGATESDNLLVTLNLSSGFGTLAWRSGLPIMNCALLGPGFLGLFEILGEIALPDAIPPVQMPAPGYVFRVVAQSNCDSPVQVDHPTWGRMKSLYR